MGCRYNCRLCDRLILSNAVTFNGTSLVINLPAGSYANNCKYCIVIAQTIPTTATIAAPVVITIGDGTTEYPLTSCDCRQVTACGVRTRTRYSVIVKTSGQTNGTFRMLGRPCCQINNDARAINGGAAAAAPAVNVAQYSAIGKGINTKGGEDRA